MTASVYTNAIETFAPMLGTLSGWLDKPGAGALVDARLAPDMYPLATQVQLACHHARDFVARITGREPPAFDGAEEGVAELKARIATTIELLKKVPAGAFEGADERDIAMPLQGTLVLEMKGHQFLRDWALPHFYFHVVTAYDILRHHGVELGKQDYLGHIGYAIRQHGGA
jgi:hypothetical protein